MPTLAEVLHALACVCAGSAIIILAVRVLRESQREEEAHVGHRTIYNAARRRFECECGQPIR